MIPVRLMARAADAGRRFGEAVGRRALLPPAARHLSGERVQDIVDGEPPWLDEAVHLLWCARCAEELESYQRVVELVRELARAASGSLPDGTRVPRARRSTE